MHKLSEGKGDVRGGDGRAVMKPRARIEANLHPAEVVGIARRLGDKRIVAARLVVGRGKQAIVERLGACAGIAARGVTVKVIVSAYYCLSKLAAFWRGGIRIVEVAEAGRVFRFAQRGEGTAFAHDFRAQRRAKGH